jgi:hypothetical protein
MQHRTFKNRRSMREPLSDLVGAPSSLALDFSRANSSSGSFLLSN